MTSAQRGSACDLDQIKRPACRRAEHGRPAGAEEFWAISLASRDEADTGRLDGGKRRDLAMPILDLGDEVSARMAFKESYIRIVAQARAARQPVT